MSRNAGARRAQVDLCPTCGRTALPLVPCCAVAREPARVELAPPPPPIVEPPRPIVREVVREVLGFEIVRPPGPWGAERGLSLAHTPDVAAHSMLMFSGPSTAVEHLPILERAVRIDGARVNETLTPAELHEVAKAATHAKHTAKFPGRLARLIDAGRLPRPTT